MPTAEELLATKRTQLAEVQAAISKIVVHGASYQIGDGVMQRGLQRAKLVDLQAREAKLETEIARLEGGGISVSYGLLR